MRDEIREATYRELTPAEMDFYMQRGRALRAQAFWAAAGWIARQLRALVAGAPAPNAPLRFAPEIKGPLPHVD